MPNHACLVTRLLVGGRDADQRGKGVHNTRDPMHVITGTHVSGVLPRELRTHGARQGVMQGRADRGDDLMLCS